MNSWSSQAAYLRLQSHQVPAYHINHRQLGKSGIMQSIFHLAVRHVEASALLSCFIYFIHQYVLHYSQTSKQILFPSRCSTCAVQRAHQRKHLVPSSSCIYASCRSIFWQQTAYYAKPSRKQGVVTGLGWTWMRARATKENHLVTVVHFNEDSKTAPEHPGKTHSVQREEHGEYEHASDVKEIKTQGYAVT